MQQLRVSSKAPEALNRVQEGVEGKEGYEKSDDYEAVFKHGEPPIAT